MADPTLQELQESIEELEAYRSRLRDDVIAMGKKLKLPQKRIDATVAEHAELQRLEQCEDPRDLAGIWFLRSFPCNCFEV